MKIVVYGWPVGPGEARIGPPEPIGVVEVSSKDVTTRSITVETNSALQTGSPAFYEAAMTGSKMVGVPPWLHVSTTLLTPIRGQALGHELWVAICTDYQAFCTVTQEQLPAQIAHAELKASHDLYVANLKEAAS